MILKDQLLDAYMTLNGSWSQHLAMLITCFFVLQNPDDLQNYQNIKGKAHRVYQWSLLTHSACFIVKLLMKWGKAERSPAVQTLDACLVLVHVYLFLLSIESYADLDKAILALDDRYDKVEVDEDFYRRLGK